MPILERERIGPYRLIRQIGWGGFGAVYEGRRLLSNQRWAVKVLRQQHFNDQTSRERFLREAQTQSTLNHPHIVAVNDYGFDRDWAYLAMPLIDGGTLQDVLNAAIQRGFLLDIDQIFYYLKQICAALDYAHGQNVVHLDIKPQNLLLRYDGHLLLADFGLAHFMAGEALRTGSNEPAGTPEYMAPERWTGDPVRRSDIYALGIMLYQMLTGRVPFKENDRMKLMRCHLQDTAAPLSLTRPDVPQALEQVVNTALAKDPQQRYASAGKLLEGFHSACPGLRDVPVPYRPYGIARQSMPMPSPPSLYRRTLAALGALFKGALIPRTRVLQTLRAINWSTFGLTDKTWFPRIIWHLPPLLFAADMLALPIAAGLWFHSWWVLGAAFLLPLLVLAFAGIAGDSKRRFLALVGAFWCGLLWGLVGWALGALLNNPAASLALGVIAGAGGLRLHSEAFPAQGRFIDSQTEFRYWRWWLLGAVHALAIPILLGIALRSSEVFGVTALAAAALCLAGIIGDKRGIQPLWKLAALLLALLWGSAGWALGLAAKGPRFTLAGNHLSTLALTFAALAAPAGYLAIRLFFLRRPLRWPGAFRLKGMALLALDLLSLPAVLGLWFQSWAVCLIGLGSLLAIFWLARRGYQRPSGLRKKHLPIVFGLFLASVIWGSAAWAIGLLFPLPRFSLLAFTLSLQGNWLAALLALASFLACTPIHLRFFPITRRLPGAERDRKTIRIWVVCAWDLFGIPLLLHLAQRAQWLPTLSALAAFALLLLAVLVDLWEEPGMKYLTILLAALFWAFAGWVLGLHIAASPVFSLSIAGMTIRGTWATLAAAVIGFSIGWPLHQANFSRRGM